MANETSISRAVLVGKLNDLAETVRERHGVSIRFVETLGRRWSYVAGLRDDLSFLPPERIELNGRYGVVSGRWNDIAADEKEQLIASAKALLALYDEGRNFTLSQQS
jgi:hypothetical protein